MANPRIISIHGETYRIEKREGDRLYLVKAQVGPRGEPGRSPGSISPRDEMRKKEAERKVSAILRGGSFDGQGLDVTLIEKARAFEEENERLKSIVQMQTRLIRSNHYPDCSITLKLKAFDAKDGIDADTLYLMLNAFEEIVKVSVREFDESVDAEIRVVGVRPGCLQVNLLIILISAADINTNLNIDPVSLVTNGLSCLFAYLSFRYAKQSAMQKQSSMGNASAGDIARNEWQGEPPSNALIRAARRFFEWASSSLEGDVIIARPSTGVQEDSLGEETLTIKPDQIEALIQYSDELDDPEENEDDEGDETAENSTV